MPADDLDALLPHRPPFRLLDRVTALDDESIAATTTARAGDPLWTAVFAGHYPGRPIVPGVLLCEMVFQAGAILLGRRLGQNGGGVPLLTRIRQAKFRRVVEPDEPLEVTARLLDQAGPAVVLEGEVKAGGKTAVRVEFAVTRAAGDEAAAP